MEGEATLAMSVLAEHPEWRDTVERMVQWETGREWQSEYDGFLWHEVRCHPRILSQMVAEGVINLVSESRRYTHYRLADREAARAAVTQVSTSPDDADNTAEHVTIEELFQYVVGHDAAKAILRYALAASEPVHTLLIGPVGTAKTMMLDDIGKLRGAEFYVGSTTTKVGLVDLLISRRPRYLVIDELDKMQPTDMSPLLNLMEGGLVTRLKHRVNERVQLNCSVFAGANAVTHIPAPVLSRFVRLQIPGYTSDEFVDVARTVLMQKLGIGPEQAYNIATEVVRVSLDVRDAIKVGRLTKGHPMRVFEVVKALWPPDKAKNAVTPIRQRVSSA